MIKIDKANDSGYSYKDGYKEGVVFVFYRNGKLLIELRPMENVETQNFFPNGSIELKDYNGQKDYKITALLREIGEKFNNITYYICNEKISNSNYWWGSYWFCNRKGIIKIFFRYNCL